MYFTVHSLSLYIQRGICFSIPFYYIWIIQAAVRQFKNVKQVLYFALHSSFTIFVTKLIKNRNL